MLGLAAFALGGCGSNEVAVTVDMLSFVPAADRSADYLIPPGVLAPPQAIDPQLITLGESLAERVNMERVALNFVVEFVGAEGTGAGSAEVALYLAAPDSSSLTAAFYQRPPIYTGHLDVAGGTTRVLAGAFEATAENGLLGVFQGGDFALGLTIAFDASASPSPLAGRWTIRQIDALVLGQTDPL
jgi:hypothetical protein